KRAYCLKTQPATGETYPKSDLFNKAYIGLNIGLDEFKPRLHHSYHNAAPVKIQPMMESYRTGEPVNKLHHDVWENNVLLSRTETLLLHTLETDRLSEYRLLTDRLPQLSSAICI
ncbi:DUF6012 family protein, partial [Klebsiella michiganensis]|uniref:DUF6012 family protein n=1 Tax=Klebsiella michiganensis TaxID=1134687 RepID=UPI001F5D9C39